MAPPMQREETRHAPKGGVPTMLSWGRPKAPSPTSPLGRGAARRQLPVGRRGGGNLCCYRRLGKASRPPHSLQGAPYGKSQETDPAPRSASYFPFRCRSFARMPRTIRPHVAHTSTTCRLHAARVPLAPVICRSRAPLACCSRAPLERRSSAARHTPRKGPHRNDRAGGARTNICV